MTIPSQTLLSLQAIRFFAAIFVAFVHLEAQFSVGHFGVDLFFILSGYVIAMILARGELALTFLKKRIIRIIPLYWLTTSIILALIFFRPDMMPKVLFSIEHYLKSLFFLPYMNIDGKIYPLYFLGWTLAYEMFFYACAFVSLLIAPKKTLVTPILIGFIILFIVIGNILPVESAVVNFISSKISLEFILGIGVYCFTQKYPRIYAINKVWFAVIIFIMLLLLLKFETSHQTDYRFLVLGIPSLMIVISILAFEEKLQSLSIKLKFMIFHLGEACYAIYLTHVFTLRIITKYIQPYLPFLDTKTMLGAAIGLVATITVGVITHNFIEKPMMRGLRSILLSKR